MSARILGAAAVVLSCSAMGCGGGLDKPAMGKVSGTVTYKGSPVSKGTVSFFPIEGKGGDSDLPAISELGSDGTFELTTFDTGDGAVLGQHKAIVLSRSESAAQVADDRIPSQAPADLKKAAAANRPLVPEKYMDPEKTPLRYTVRPGTNNFSLDLKD